MNIILYDFEVQNLLKNGKGQIRRVCKVQPPDDSYKLGREISGRYDGKLFWYNPDGFFAEAQHFTCPFGAVGEEIWCKETWFKNAPGGITKYFYKADEQPDEVVGQMSAFGYSWRSPVTMPHEASRLTIVPETIWTERVQKIMEEEAIAEGFEGEVCTHPNADEHGCTDCYNTGWIEPPQVGFMQEWDSYAKPGYKWADNPMVFAAEVCLKH